MSGVVSLNGQAETFASLNNSLSNDDHQRKVLQHVNKVVSLSDSCHTAKTCPMTDNGSSSPNNATADVTPDPGYVIKAVASGTGMKVFVNVCKSESTEKPSISKQIARDGRCGLSWTVPHTLTEQVTNGSQYNQTYRVFDFQVHPDTCRMAETNNRFKNMLNELAVGAIAEEFLLHINARKLQFPKMKYKAVQVISRKKDAILPQSSTVAVAEVSGKGNVSILNFSKQQNSELSEDSRKYEMQDQEKGKQHAPINTDANNNKFTAPKYTVTFLNSEEVPVINGVTFSKMLVVDIELPLVNSALAINLDVFETSLKLMSAGHVRYKLEIDLPCVVDENRSIAKFVKSRKVLQVMMPVLTSSSSCTSSIESSSTSDSGEMLVSESGVNNEHVSSSSVVPTEIASGQRADLEYAKDENVADEYEHCSTNSDSHMLQFSHEQDPETLKLTFSVKNVVPSSVCIDFLDDRMCKIEMNKEVDDGGVLSRVCCFLKLDEGCKCKDGGFTVDVTDVSVVLVIAKASECHHMWNTFWTGPDINHLEVRHMLPVTVFAPFFA